MKKITVSIINTSAHELPEYQTTGAAGMDLRANLLQDVTLAPFQRMLLPTGLSMAIPPGFEAQVRPRSGLAIKQGITVINSPGTIDADYRGEVKVALINLSDEPQMIRNGDRIAQLVISKHEQVDWDLVTVLESTERGSGGFGHTGL